MHEPVEQILEQGVQDPMITPQRFAPCHTVEQAEDADEEDDEAGKPAKNKFLKDAAPPATCVVEDEVKPDSITMPIADFKAHIKSACEASAAATAAELEGLLHGQQCQIADLEYEIGTLTRSLRETNEGCIEDFQKIKKLEAQLAQRKRR